MSKLKPKIDTTLFKMTHEQMNTGKSVGSTPLVPLHRVEKEFDIFEEIDISDENHRRALHELFPPYLISQRDNVDWELFLSMSRYDRRNQTFIAGCFDNQPLDFKLISHKLQFKDGVKWKTRAGTSPNGTPFVRIYTDSEIIYIPEGHRDSLTAVLLGLDFIMIPYAGFRLKEPSELQSEIRNRDLVFIVEDEAAYKCMTKVAEHLKETAKSICFIELIDTDEKVDLSDYVKNFKTIQEVIDGLQNRR